MIGSLRGKILVKNENNLILEVSGVGYKVFTTNYILEKNSLEENIFLYVYTHVREQEISLYGFATIEEQKMFELLISVSGIGPKAGLNLLSIADVKAIKTAIINKEVSILTQVSGVGKKTAEKVILELSGKVDAIEVDIDGATANMDVINALKSMGYSISESRDALEEVPDDITDTSEKIRLALKFIGKK
jgi:Holliday junction DNA helicase RuvA